MDNYSTDIQTNTTPTGERRCELVRFDNDLVQIRCLNTGTHEEYCTDPDGDRWVCNGHAVNELRVAVTFEPSDQVATLLEPGPKDVGIVKHTPEGKKEHPNLGKGNDWEEEK